MAKNLTVPVVFFPTLMATTIIFLFFNDSYIFDQASTFILLKKEKIKHCDLFEGQWIPDTTGLLYTNYSCTTIPLTKNCLLNGRKDQDFLHWRWKPHECELPRFDPQSFLNILRGKSLAFIGDSLARNQMESLLCLLSTVETPKSIENKAEDKSATWEFPKHNFRLMALWSQFLVVATEIVVNGTNTGNFDLQLDRVDPRWSEKLPSLDFAVFSAGHWFIRPNNLYEGGNFVGSVFSHAPNVTSFEPAFSIRKAVRTALKAVNECKNCKKMASFLMTFSPGHFENGEWNTGGVCNRTRPVGRDEVDMSRPYWEFRRIEVKEVETARNLGNHNLEVVDITEMMSVRADAHPELNWENRWKITYRDCVHWCLPGPIDTWNGLLLEMIKRKKR